MVVGNLVVVVAAVVAVIAVLAAIAVFKYVDVDVIDVDDVVIVDIDDVIIADDAAEDLDRRLEVVELHREHRREAAGLEEVRQTRPRLSGILDRGQNPGPLVRALLTDEVDQGLNRDFLHRRQKCDQKVASSNPLQKIDL